jgi:protoporphyrin/coproporphyrin ferrochelatase
MATAVTSPERGDEKAAVLAMAYGTPASLDDVEAYYTHILHGRPPPPEAVKELTRRYEAIGGRSPLLEITTAQAEAIGKAAGVPAYVGQKHAAPFIDDAVEAMARDGIERAVGLVLAPHYSSMSVGDYERRARAAAAASGWDGKLEMVKSWHLEPDFISITADRVRRAMDGLSAGTRNDAVVVFTAHSLPERILQKNDPYSDQLAATGAAVAKTAGLKRWQVGWQSAGATDTPWLGPDILEVLPELAEEGAPAVVVCPCGFVADHLEVLYDLDIEAAGLARELGIEFARTASPNDDPAFTGMLAHVVRRAIGD